MIFSEQIRFASLWDIWFEWSPYNSINVFKIHIYKCIYLLSRCFGGIKFEWAFWWSSLWNHIRWYCLNYGKKKQSLLNRIQIINNWCLSSLFGMRQWPYDKFDRCSSVHVFLVNIHYQTLYLHVLFFVFLSKNYYIFVCSLGTSRLN